MKNMCFFLLLLPTFWLNASFVFRDLVSRLIDDLMLYFMKERFLGSTIYTGQDSQKSLQFNTRCR